MVLQLNQAGTSSRVFIDDLSYQILAHSVTSPIYIGKLIILQDGIISKMLLVFVAIPEDFHSLLDKVEIVLESIVVGNDTPICHCIV